MDAYWIIMNEQLNPTFISFIMFGTNENCF
jgi:hypothetical protein